MDNIIQNGKYDDIINMEHHISEKHQRMSLENRSAQFAPFSALTGYDDEVEEVCRYTEEQKYIDEEKKEEINNKLQIIKQYKDKRVIIQYFEKDSKKEGGKYIKIEGKIKKIDDYQKAIYMDNNQKILLDNIININIE